MHEQETEETRTLPQEWKVRVSRRGFLTTSSAALATTGVATIGGALVRDAVAAPPAQSTPVAMATPTGDMPTMGADERPIQFFNIHEAATVDAIVSRIMPGDADDPGAHEAGVVFYIDQSLGGANLGYTLKTYTQGPFPIVREDPVPVEMASTRDIYDYISVASDQVSRYGYQSVLSPQEVYRRGIEFVDAYAQSTFEQDFIDLTPEQQDQILTDMDEGNATEFAGPSGKAFFTQLRNDTIEGMFGDPMYGGNRDLAGWNLIGYPGAQRFYTPDDIKNASFMRAPQSLAQLLENEGH
jgi:gluconate 2-dehydrogenase gamma chain